MELEKKMRKPLTFEEKFIMNALESDDEDDDELQEYYRRSN